MFQKYSCLIFVICVICSNADSVPMEPVCSKFDYEYKTLEAMLRIERRVEDMKKEIEKTQDDVAEKLQELEELKQKQETDLSMLRQSLEENATASPGIVNDKDVPGIAFSVGNPTLSEANGSLLFKTTSTNVGGAYDSRTGEFTCPIDGIYIFVLTIATKHSSSESYCRIRLNHKNVVISRSYYTKYTTTSNTVFLALKKDDVVAPGDCYGVTNLYVDYSATSFSGALISKV